MRYLIYNTAVCTETIAQDLIMFVRWRNSETSDGCELENLTLDEGLGADVDMLFIVYVPARGIKTKKKIPQTPARCI